MNVFLCVYMWVTTINFFFFLRARSGHPTLGETEGVLNAGWFRTLRFRRAKGVLTRWHTYRSVKRPPATNLQCRHFCLFAQWRFSTSATPDATEDVPAPVCFGCDLLRCCKTQERTKPTGVSFHSSRKMFPKTPTRLPTLLRRSPWPRLFWGDALAAWVRAKKKQEKQQQRFERGQPPPKICANCVERARRRTIFGTFGVEGSSGARKCHSNASQPASKSQPGAMDHEVNCF